MENTIQILLAKYYKAIFENNLIICGVEERLPQLIGDTTDFSNFQAQVESYGY